MKKITIFTLFLTLSFIPAALFSQNSKKADTPKSDKGIFYHTVERGQTVYSIATMYKVNVEDIYELNTNSRETIKEGEILKIPKKQTVTTVANAFSEQEDIYTYHTIETGETLYGLSKQYAVNGEQIIEANPGLSLQTFSMGKTIRIPTNKKHKRLTEIIQSDKGAKEVYYTVPSKETMYNMCKKFRTSEEELLALNPELSGGLRTGMTLRIPLRINENDLPIDKRPGASEMNAMLTEKKETKYVNAAKVALLLPYDEADSSKTAIGNRITEYYEGLLLAAEKLREQGHSIELFVYDIDDGTEELQNIIRKNSNILSEVNLIIGGISNNQIKIIADFAQKNKIKYVIPFTSRNEEVLHNAYVFQVNTPQPYLYANAAHASANLFANHHIIFLDTEDKDSQTEFINRAKEELKSRNITYKDAVYDAASFSASMRSLLSKDKPNVIIPFSSSLEALAKIKSTLRTLAASPEYELTLFGYPVWQTYSKDCLEDFHALNTHIYSLFYADDNSSVVKSFHDKYKHWYSKNPMPTFPKYAMLGYDTGMFFLKAIQKYGTNFENNLFMMDYNSVQTGFHFERVNNWGGFINTNIYIINYKRDHSITRSDFR